MRTCKSKTTHLFRTAYSLITQMDERGRDRLDSDCKHRCQCTISDHDERPGSAACDWCSYLPRVRSCSPESAPQSIRRDHAHRSRTKRFGHFHNDVTGNQRFTPQEASVIQSDCNFKHPPVSGKAAEDQGSWSSVLVLVRQLVYTIFGVPPKDYNEVCCICFC